MTHEQFKDCLADYAYDFQVLNKTLDPSLACQDVPAAPHLGSFAAAEDSLVAAPSEPPQVHPKRPADGSDDAIVGLF